MQVLVDFDQTDLLTEVDDLNQHFPSPPPCESMLDFTAERSSNHQKLDSDGSDTDDDEQPPDLPPSLFSNAQRKRAQNALFEDFVREKDDSQLREGSRKDLDSLELPDGLHSEDTASARRIIDRVRDYQSELFARAKAGNIIAVLDTGSGKTLIAALLLRDVVNKEMEDRASGKPQRTSFFLVGHFRSLHVLLIDVTSCCRQIVLLLPNNNTRCFARIWPQCQLWFMVEY